MKRLSARLILLITLILAVLAAGLLPLFAFAGPAPAQAQESGTVIVTVKIDRLRVRRAPRPSGGVLITLRREEQVTGIGRNRASTWIEVQTENGDGWLDARFVSLNQHILTLPVTDEQVNPFATVTTARRVIVRAGPFDQYPIVEMVPVGVEMDVIGLHSRNTHVEVVTPNGSRGWVSLEVVRVSGDLSGLRVTDLDVKPLAQVNTFRLRVRAEPTDESAIVTTLRIGRLYTIIGVNPTGEWLQIETPRGKGWVLRGFVKIIGSLQQFLAEPE